jgi:hypothetical protein
MPGLSQKKVDRIRTWTINFCKRHFSTSDGNFKERLILLTFRQEQAVSLVEYRARYLSEEFETFHWSSRNSYAKELVAAYQVLTKMHKEDTFPLLQKKMGRYLELQGNQYTGFAEASPDTILLHFTFFTLLRLGTLPTAKLTKDLLLDIYLHPYQEESSVVTLLDQRETVWAIAKKAFAKDGLDSSSSQPEAQARTGTTSTESVPEQTSLPRFSGKGESQTVTRETLEFRNYSIRDFQDIYMNTADEFQKRLAGLDLEAPHCRIATVSLEYDRRGIQSSSQPSEAGQQPVSTTSGLPSRRREPMEDSALLHPSTRETNAADALAMLSWRATLVPPSVTFSNSLQQSPTAHASSASRENPIPVASKISHPSERS